MAEDKRDLALSRDAREAVIEAIAIEPGIEVTYEIHTASNKLISSLPDLKSLSDGERLLLRELLDRISNLG